RSGGACLLVALVVVVVGAIWSVLPATGAAPTTSPAAGVALAAEVEELIRQLHDSNWRVRQQAQARLTNLGPTIEPRLHRLLAEGADEQTRLVTLAILAKIEADSRLGPTLVSLHADRLPPRQVFADLSRQGHIPIAPVNGESS